MTPEILWPRLAGKVLKINSGMAGMRIKQTNEAGLAGN
jgi:hypothetical protein